MLFSLLFFCIRNTSKSLETIRQVFVSVILYIIISLSAYTQDNRSFFDNYTVNNGLADNYIDCIYQDYEGWIWIGNRLGIERFDGIKFKTYNLFVDDTTQKEGLLVREFFEDTQKRLYVCYEEEGLACYNRDLDRFESMKMHYTCFNENHTAKDVIQDNRGNLWIATKEGVQKIDPENNTIKKFTADGPEGKRLSDNYVRKLCIDNGGVLWIGTRNGLDKMSLLSEDITSFSSAHPELKTEILEIFVDEKNRKWVGTSKNGVLLIDSDEEVKNIVLDKADQRSLKVNSIFQNSNKELWFGTRGGLYVLNEETNKTNHIVINELERNSLIHNSILNIFKDADGDLWICTRGGLSYYAKNKQPFIHYRSIPGNNRYLNNAEI